MCAQNVGKKRENVLTCINTFRIIYISIYNNLFFHNPNPSLNIRPYWRKIKVLIVGSNCMFAEVFITWTGATGWFLFGGLTRFLHPGKDLLAPWSRGRRAVLCAGLVGPVTCGLGDGTGGLRGRGRGWHRHLRLIAFRMNFRLNRLNGCGPVTVLSRHLPLLQSHGAVRRLQGAGGSMVLTFHMRGPGILDLIGIITEAICALIWVATVNCRAVVIGCLLHLAVSQYLFQKLTGSWHPCRITLAPRGHVTPLRQWPPRANLGLQEALWGDEMVAIHLTFQCRADTGDYGGKIGPTVLRTITVYLMACTKPRTNPVVPSVLDNTNTKNLAKEMQNLMIQKECVCYICFVNTKPLYV